MSRRPIQLDEPTPYEMKKLVQFFQSNGNHELTNRVTGVILLADGLDKHHVSKACGVHYQTVVGWTNKWNNDRLGIIKESRGRPSISSRPSKFCIDCDKEISPRATRCGRCDRLSRFDRTYLVNRKKDMLHLRHDKKYTLQRIADKYKISRERVRQIIGNTGPKHG